MEEIKQHLSDLTEIKKIMERSAKFISLSGLSGIFAGTTAILGSIAAYFLFYEGKPWIFTRGFEPVVDHLVMKAILLAAIILIVALSGAVYFSIRKARKQGVSFWNQQAWMLAYNLAIPLITGGLFCLILILNSNFNLIAPAMLVFYGLALINAGKYTVHEIRLLGYSEIILGLICGFVNSWGLVFWVLGFGVLHIVYGAVMYFRYDK
jgi:hypothetical protein